MESKLVAGITFSNAEKQWNWHTGGQWMDGKLADVIPAVGFEKSLFLHILAKMFQSAIEEV